MSVELAVKADIPAIMALERGAGFEGQVGRWSADEHSAEMAKASSRYFLMRENGQTTGFVMVQGLGDAHGKAHLRRIAVASPGTGAGSRLLLNVLDWLYTHTDVNRVDLDVYIDNERAKRSYEKAGFKLEGRLRDFHRNEDGSYRDMWLMSILRREWEARR